MNDKQETINYQDCIDLGFERTNLGDELFIAQYGFDWFSVEMRVMKQLYFSWDCNTRLVTLRRGGVKTVKAITVIYNLKHLKNTIKFFTEDTGFDIKEPEQEQVGNFNDIA